MQGCVLGLLLGCSHFDRYQYGCRVDRIVLLNLARLMGVTLDTMLDTPQRRLGRFFDLESSNSQAG